MKTKLLRAASNLKYEFIIFLMLCIRACMNIDFQNGMDKNFLLYYLVDFSMSKTSRLLVGSFVNLLTDNPTKLWINCFAGIVLLLTFIFTSVLIGRIIRNADDNMKPCVFVLSLFFASGSFTLHGFSKFFGMLDIYMYLFTVLSLMALQNKFLKWLVPFFCIGGVLVNYSFAISFFPAVVFALLYLIITNSQNRASNIVLLTITVAVSLLLTVYCIFWGELSTTVTFDEMKNIVEQKSGMEFNYPQLKYYDYYLFGNDQGVEELGINIDNDSLSGIINTYYEYMTLYGYNYLNVLSVIIGVLPILAVFMIIWIKCIKMADTKPRKFVYLCFMLSILFVLACCMTSTDITRWTCVGVIVQFVFAYCMIIYRDQPFENVMLRLKKIIKNRTVLLAVLLLVYAFGFDLSLTG